MRTLPFLGLSLLLLSASAAVGCGTEGPPPLCTGVGCNECGGYEALGVGLGEPCGDCGGGSWVCDGREAVRCADATAGQNDCGGCDPLMGSPEDACGACMAGRLVCDGTDALRCEEADLSLNACGGCAALSAEPGAPCGPCEMDTYVCDGTDAVACGGATQCTDGATCEVDEDCPQGHNTIGRCAPLGYSYVPAGTFVMGAPLGEPGLHPDRENGQHTVILTRHLLVSQTELTQGEWVDMYGSNPSYFSSCGDECPVENVNWWEAITYANDLSMREGLTPCYDFDGCVGTFGDGCPAGSIDCNGYRCTRIGELDLDCDGYRLPTESEWEYFGRAGTTTPFITPDGTFVEWDLTGGVDPQMDMIAWYAANAGVSYAGGVDCGLYTTGGANPCGTHPVAQKLPNSWGLYDITGNVWERVWDFSGDYPDPGTTVTDPTGPETGSYRRMRGGSFPASGRYLRIAYRTGPGQEYRVFNAGFRLVRTLHLPAE